MITSVWLILGVVFGAVLILVARKDQAKGEKKLLINALVVAAVVYAAFAIMWGNAIWLFIEIAGVLVYGFFAWAATRYSAYWLAVGWLLHPVWDVGLHLIGNGNVLAPEWYAVGCISFDVLVAGYVFYKIPHWMQPRNKAMESSDRIGAKHTPPD